MKKVLLLLLSIMFLAGCSQQDPLPENYDELISKYTKTKQTDSLVILLDRVLTEVKDLSQADRLSYLRKHVGLLINLKKFDKALPYAIEYEKTSERKSPYRVKSIAECYLGLNQTDKASKEIDRMLELGFKNHSEFDKEPFNVIKKLEEFDKISKKIDENIGIGNPAKDFTLKDIEGKVYTLSELKGKVVLVDFWATWCPPCREEIPDLVKYYNELNKEGFEILGVSLDYKNKLENVKKFMADQNMNWPVFYSGKGWFDDTAKYYEVNSIPSTWLIDKKGVLRYFAIHGEEIKEKVKELLAE